MCAIERERHADQDRRYQSPTVELLVLALPIIAMMVSRMLITFIDFVMVSQLGTEAQAAISPASMFVFLLGVIGLGIAHGVQTFVSQADGRGQPHLAGAYAWQSFYIGAAFAVLVAPFAVTTEHWFHWIADLGHHEQAVRSMEIDYVRVALWSVPFSIMCIGLNAFFNGIRRPWITLAAVLASLAANVFGNWVLIFGHLGFPAMGIRGAAYATVGAWIVRALVLWAALVLPQFDRVYQTRRAIAFSWQKMAGLIRVGAPTSIGWLADLGAWTLFMMIIMPPYGKEAMAAGNVAFQLIHLSFMPALGVGIALSSQVGFSIGQGRPDLARQWTRTAFRLIGGFMGVAGLLFLVARTWIVSLFNADPDVIRLGGVILIWAAAFQVFDAMMITYMNALRGAGDTRWPAAVMGSLCVGVFLGGGYAMSRLAPQLGVSGPWAMCSLYVISLGLLLLWRWNSGAWREIRLFDDRPKVAMAD